MPVPLPLKRRLAASYKAVTAGNGVGMFLLDDTFVKKVMLDVLHEVYE